MLWLLGLLCLFNNAQASLQSYYDDIKGRTRWCLGEGQTCSLNLLQGVDFSLCCAPYICTTIIKAREPNWLISSEYREYKCFLPPSFIVSRTLEDDVGNSSKKLKVNMLDDQQTDSYDNNSRRSEENEVHVVKRSISDSQLFKTMNSNIIEETKANQLEDNITITSFASNSSEWISPINLTNSSMAISSEYGDNKTESMQYGPLTNYSESSGELLGNSFNVTVSDKPLDIRDKTVENQNTGTNSTFQNTSSEVFSDEDWHSSEMQYDTRPTLRKVVTVLPFHFFDNVKVIKINESFETSAE